MPLADRQELTAIIEEAGSVSRMSSPIGWLRLEPEEHVFRLKLRLWPDGEGREELLAEAHPHGRWVHWKVRGLRPMVEEIDDG